MKTNTLLLAKRYAAAYDALAKDAKEAQVNLAAYNKALEALEGAKAYINNPCLPFKVKADILAKVLEDGKEASLIKLLVSAKRFYLAQAVSLQISELIDKRLGLQRVSVTSAAPVNDAARAALSSALEQYFNSKVAVTFTQDETLLAGVVVCRGDLRIDGSAAGRIEQLTKNLTER